MTSPLRPAALWPTALLVGIGVFFFTCLVEPAQPHTLNFGTEYGQMAADPFGFVGKFPHRILGPLLAHCLDHMAGWFGAALPYWVFAHGCTMVLIAVLFAAAVRHGATLLQALLLTCVIAFTGTVQLYKGHVGYPDPITFAFLIGSLLAVKRPWLFWSLQALNLLNHEQIFFFWPWLIYWRHRVAAPRWWQDGIGAGVVAGLYVLWRLYVGSHAAEQKLTMEHYMGLGYFPVGTLGLAILNVASTYMWFGLLPVVICWHGFVDGWKQAGFSILLFLTSIFAIFAVAHDVYRFTCFLFVPLFFAGLRLMQRPHGALVLVALGAASIYAIRQQAVVFFEVGKAVLFDMAAPGGPALRPEPVATIVPVVIPSMPGTFLAYGGALVATVLVGWWWARRDRRQMAAVMVRAQ